MNSTPDDLRRRIDAAFEGSTPDPSAVEDTIELLNVSISAGVVVRPQLGEDLPEAAGDPSQVRQVLMNLVINAAEAVGNAGTITVRTAAVQLDETGIRQMHRGSVASAGPWIVEHPRRSDGLAERATCAKITVSAAPRLFIALREHGPANVLSLSRPRASTCRPN